MFQDNDLFFVGCNYWASHAGTYMWRNWDASVVERDFRNLSEHGVRVLRVFPVWSDFQPLTAQQTGGNRVKEFRFGDTPPEHTDIGRAGVDPAMLEHFHEFSQLALKYNLKLIVGLITGWMSGRMYTPLPFIDKNLITDPKVVIYQVRFVRVFVRELKNEPAIAAWDWGNECNVISGHTNEEMWLWGNAITQAIKAEDRTRPVVSGLHGGDLQHVEYMGELADILCTHPYPAFTPHCNTDPLDSFKSPFHAAAETMFISAMGGKPAFVEEIGSFAMTHNSEKVSADYLRNAYFNAYAHNCYGALWWCANDQSHLNMPPYDWCAMERPLGLLTKEGKAKPVLLETQKFGAFAEAHPLPKHWIDAVCILTNGQDVWGAAYMTFLLAKRAGFDIDFSFCEHKIKESKVYLMPSLNSYSAIPRHVYVELLKQVYNGASLYISTANSGLEPLSPLGIIIETVSQADGPGLVRNPALGLDLEINRTSRVRLSADGAEVLALDAEGNPTFTCANYGKGKILFLNVPLETSLMDMVGAFESGAQPYHRIYELIAEKTGIRRLVSRDNPGITLTEHPVNAEKTLITAMNNLTSVQRTVLNIASGWQVQECAGGVLNGDHLELAAKTGCVISLKKG